MKIKNIIWFCVAWVAIGSSAMAQGGYNDDLYGAPRRTVSTKNERTTRKAQREQTFDNRYYGDYQNEKIYNELVTSYEEAMARRVDAYNNDEPRPESYHKLMDEYREILLGKYNPDLYNIIEFNNMMWVEPKDITALFDGSDPAQGVKQYSQNYKKMDTRQSDGSDAETRSKVQISLVVGLDPWFSPYYGPSLWGVSPYYYGGGWGWNLGFGWGTGFSPYYDPYWGYGAFWGPSWGYPGWNYPMWGYRPGWGHHHHHGGHYPGWGGGSHGGGSSRPVIHGSGGRYDGSTNGSPSLRPGSAGGGSLAERPSYRRGSGGTNVVNYNTGRPSTSRPGAVNSTRPSSGSGSNRPSGGVQVNRPTRDQWESSQSSRPSSSPSVSRPSRPSSSPSVSRPSSSPSVSRPSSAPSRPSGGSAPSRGGGRR